MYLAGLWKKSLLKDLLWRTPWGSNTARPTEYLASSWSWASIIGPIVYDEYIHDHKGDVEDRTTVLRPKILDAAAEPAGRDPFGRLKAGFIQLEGIMKPSQVRYGTRQGLKLYEIWDQEQKIGHLTYDIHPEFPEEESCQIVCLYFGPDNYGRSEMRGLGLALAPCLEEGEGVYRRVGRLDELQSAWFASTEPTIITII